jgi:hypothetical protein
MVLIVVVPGVIGEAPLTEALDTSDEGRVLELAFGVDCRDRHRCGLAGACEGVTNATEAPPASVDMRIEDLIEVFGVGKIGVSDNSCDWRA